MLLELEMILMPWLSLVPFVDMLFPVIILLFEADTSRIPRFANVEPTVVIIFCVTLFCVLALNRIPSLPNVPPEVILFERRILSVELDSRRIP